MMPDADATELFHHLTDAAHHRRRRSPGKPRVSPTVLDRINPNVAGIDCGSAEHFVAVPPDRDATPVQSFKTFTSDLLGLADWLAACRVTSVAMEATGVYWIPVYEILEARGFEVLLVNARHRKNVPGRKSDVCDCAGAPLRPAAEPRTV